MTDHEVRAVVKILSANDVGETRSHQAGMLIPKSPGVLAFFPTLNPKVKNPDAQLTVKHPDSGSEWRLRFVYYNGKLLDDGTRNEYRLTGITKMMRDLEAHRGDSLTFRRSTSGDILVSLEPLNRANPESQVQTSSVALPGGWRIVAVEEE